MMKPFAITLEIDLDELLAAVLKRVGDGDPMAWLRQQFNALEQPHRAQSRRQRAWTARAAQERVKIRARRLATLESRSRRQ